MVDNATNINKRTITSHFNSLNTKTKTTTFNVVKESLNNDGQYNKASNHLSPSLTEQHKKGISNLVCNTR
jgi:hypothetical protein